MIKDLVKSILASWKCRMNHVSSSGRCFFGHNVSIYNSGKMTIGQGTLIRSHSDLFSSEQGELVIGEGCDIGNRARIAAGRSVVLGSHVLTGPNVTIIDYNHQYRDPSVPIMHQGNTPYEEMGIEIGEGSWIGANAVVVDHVNNGKHCVVGANSVVIRDIPDYSVAVGNPAKIVKRYDFSQNKWVRV